MDRRIEAIKSDFSDDDADEPPSPIDEGAVLGSTTKFGLTWAPAIIVAAPLVVLGYIGVLTVFDPSSLADPGAFIGLIALVLPLTWLVSLFAFCWAMLFAEGGSPEYGFGSVVCLLLFLFSGGVLSGIPVLQYLDLVAYFGLVGIASLHLREAIAELR